MGKSPIVTFIFVLFHLFVLIILAVHALYMHSCSLLVAQTLQSTKKALKILRLCLCLSSRAIPICPRKRKKKKAEQSLGNNCSGGTLFNIQEGCFVAPIILGTVPRDLWCSCTRRTLRGLRKKRKGKCTQRQIFCSLASRISPQKSTYLRNSTEQRSPMLLW